MSSSRGGRVEGRVCVVTGAARGMGAATAGLLVAEGATVVVTDKRDELGRDTAAALGPAASYESLDVTSEHDWQRVVEGVLERHGRLDVLVNNAGVLKPHLTVKVTPAELDELVAVNLSGPVQLSVRALEDLGAHGVGSIVNIGAVCAYQPMEGIGGYCAVKAAMANWSTTMAREWARLGVRVNVLVPGSIATEMILPRDPERRVAFEVEMAAQNLFGRLGDPDDLVGAAVFLASDASRFTTGRALFVDGGLLR